MNNLESTVFVYRTLTEPFVYHAVYFEQAKKYENRPDIWKHTSTINPAAWIEHLLNNPTEHIKNISLIA